MKTAAIKKEQLTQLLKSAEAEATRLYQQTQAAKSLDSVAQKALSKKFQQASRKATELRHLAAMTEPFMEQRMDYAKDCHKQALTYSSPTLRKRTLARAAKLEREYLLWCAHHGKTPTLHLTQPTPEPKAKAPEPAPETTGHGGRRKGSGRKACGKKQLLLRVKPATTKRLKELAKRAGFATPGEWLDAQMEKESA